MKSLFFVVAILLVGCVAFSSAGAVAAITKITGAASNQYLVFSGGSAFLIDTGFYGTGNINQIEAAVNASNSELLAVYITHPHPDHYSGAVEVHALYPNVPIYVVNNTYKAAVVANVQALSAALPPAVTSFNWTGVLQVLPDPNQLTFISNTGNTFDVVDDFLPNESDLQSIVVSTSSERLFGADLLYVDDHLYLGPAVDATKVGNWKNILRSLNQTYQGYTIYPGHGDISTDISAVVASNIDYLDFFLTQLCTPGANITAALIGRYPTWSGQSLLQFIDANPAWAAYQQATCPPASETQDDDSSSAITVFSSTVLVALIALFASLF